MADLEKHLILHRLAEFLGERTEYGIKRNSSTRQQQQEYLQTFGLDSLLLSTKLRLLSTVIALLAGICGGMISTLILARHQALRIAVVDLQKLLRVQVAALRELQGSDKDLEQAASQAALKITQAIYAWARVHKTILLSKQQVLSPLPDVTDGVAQLMEDQP